MKKQTGFTLIEIMIVVAIIGIIAAVAFPGYQDSIRKSRRADGTGKLLEMANRMERCFTTAGRYTHASCPAAAEDSDEGYYSVTPLIPAPTASTYTLTATPQNEQAADIALCPFMSIDETGLKLPNPDPNRCWGQ